MLDTDLSGDYTYDLWIGIVRQALSCLDMKSYNWIHLPNLGGYYSQDEFFLIVWEYIRYECINAKNDPEFQKSMNIKYKDK